MDTDDASSLLEGSVASTADPTDLERAALREFCTCEKVLKLLAKRVQEKTKPLLLEASDARNALIQELRGGGASAAWKWQGSYFRVVQRATTRAITDALVKEVVGNLTEDQIQLNLVNTKGKPVERRPAIEKTVVSAIRSARTSHHDGLLVSEEPLKTIKAAPIPPSAQPHAIKLLTCREDIAQKRKSGKEARAETETRRSFASAAAIEYLKRINADKPINVTVDYADAEENDKFRVKVFKRANKVRVSAKEFAAIVAECMESVDLDSSTWRLELSDSIILGMSKIQRPEPALSLRATLKRKRDDEDAEDDDDDDEEEDDDNEEDE